MIRPAIRVTNNPCDIPVKARIKYRLISFFPVSTTLTLVQYGKRCVREADSSAAVSSSTDSTARGPSSGAGSAELIPKRGKATPPHNPLNWRQGYHFLKTLRPDDERKVRY
jgi:hypothetical protein